MPDDDLIAIHESGHAFVAVVLGLALDYVQVGDVPRYVLAAGSGARHRDCLLTLMGGCAAEQVVFDCARGGGNDDVQIASLLTEDDDETALRNEVRRFLRLNAGPLRYLAARLARSGRLSGDEVEALVRGHKPFRAMDIL